VKTSGASEAAETKLPKPGGDVRCTIDLNVQMATEDAFEIKRIHKETPADDSPEEVREHQHGAAVVIDVATGDVLAMASNPGFDPNTLDTLMTQLQADDLNMPLMDRATEMAEQPGSTIKPVVGCAAITEGVISPTDRIPCTGTLLLDGKPQPFGHCWTYSLWKSHPNIVDVPSHNAFPGGDFPNDSLTVADGLERSCNVVFETLADRLKLAQLDDWYTRFGLGRPTGIGIRSILGVRESSGTILQPSDATRTLKCLAGIGEARVLCTPIQMANVAATIARNGIWIRPHLTDAPLSSEDRVDLHIPPEALKADHDGMFQVINSRFGTGGDILPDKQEPISSPDDPLRGMALAGKTGTAQTSALSVHKRDEHGNLIPGNAWDRVPVGTPGTESWYASTIVQDLSDNNKTSEHFDHAWFIGYAPADHPQIAFAVLVEYGVSGGRNAGAIAHDILVACCKEGYLKK
jgi:penicillin-binding protein 2